MTSDGYYKIPRLDRVITVGVQGADTFEDGSPVEGSWTDAETWAAQVDRSDVVERRSEPGGVGLVTRRTYRVRYTDSLAEALASNSVSVVVGAGRYQVAGWREVGRRRFLDLDIWFGVV